MKKFIAMMLVILSLAAIFSGCGKPRPRATWLTSKRRAS